MQGFGIGRGGPSGVAASGASVTPRAAARRNRRGIASVLAMLYMVLFSALALGFYAQVTLSAQVSHNERRAASAQASAEAAYQFTRYQLSRVDVPMTLAGNSLVQEVYLQLGKNLNGTNNLGGGQVALGGVTGANTVAFPATGYVNLDAPNGNRFRVDMSQSGDQLVARFLGRATGNQFARAIQVKFAKTPRPTTIFNYGVASRGPITTSGASTIKGLTDPSRGSILSTSTSATPVTINGKLVSGDIGITNAKGSVVLGSGVSIGGTTNTSLIYADHVRTGVQEPRFPDVDVTVYSKYATNTYIAGMTQLDNCRVPAGVTCSLSSGTIRGVLYLEKGASLKCGGGVVVQAIIVGSTDSTDLNTNVIEFGGSMTALPVKDLPESFGEVRTFTGAFVIAPTYRVRLWGNFGSVTGTIICGQFQMGGSAEGTLVGSVIQMMDVPMTISGSADVVIAGTGTAPAVPGVSFGAYFAPQQASYLEVAP
jgi:Tfp pilus assembly protein PilX